MQNIKNVLRWILGICCLIAGIGTLLNNVFQGILYFFLGLFLVPPILIYSERQLKVKIPTPVKYGIVLFGLILATALNENKVENRTSDTNDAKMITDIDKDNSTSNSSGIDAKSGNRTIQSKEKDPNCLKYLITEDTYGTLVEDDLDKLIGYARTNEIELIQRMLRRGDAVLLKKGVGVYVSDVGFAVHKVRIESTEIELYVVAESIISDCSN